MLQGFGPTVPGMALHVLGGVEADAENPGTQVLNLVQLLAGTPALEKRLLGSVLSIIAVAQDVEQRADEFIAQGVEGLHQEISASAAVVTGRVRCGSQSLVEFGHGLPVRKDENQRDLVWSARGKSHGS